MAFLTRSFSGVLRLREGCIHGPLCTQLRWRKVPRRKPTWLPMAKSKVFRIPVHPYVPPEEKELIDSLLEEYKTKIESLRIVFKEELSQKSKDEGNTLENQQEEEEKFRLLLEENQKENERVGAIREETLNKLFEEKHMELLQLQEEKQDKQKEIKSKIELIVRREKEKHLSFITYENLDEVIDKAMDFPINVGYCIDLNGGIKWEGKPPVEFEEEIKRKMEQSIEN